MMGTVINCARGSRPPAREKQSQQRVSEMPGSLEGKVAVVTGVSHAGQVGQAVARDLAAKGAALVICARTQANVEARAMELREGGARVLPVAASLTEEPQVARLIDQTLAEYSRLDILVNLAGGLTLYKPAVEFSLEDWNAELNNNLLSAFLVTRARPSRIWPRPARARS
jgi:NAD(P)-dependent dehydrogenase (short-subunit alcohol dehydrogenase family)